jgi:hypothetical protein
MAAKKKTSKKAAPKPQHAKLKPGDRATIEAEKFDRVNLIPEHVDIRLHRETASQIATLLENEGERIWQMIHVNGGPEIRDDVPDVARYLLHSFAEECFFIAQQIEKKLDPHHPSPLDPQ